MVQFLKASLVKTNMRKEGRSFPGTAQHLYHTHACSGSPDDLHKNQDETMSMNRGVGIGVQLLNKVAQVTLFLPGHPTLFSQLN